MKKLFILFLTLFVASSVGVYAQIESWDFKKDGIAYKIYGNDVYVWCDYFREGSPYPTYSGEVTIPESVTYQGQTYQVTGIGEFAFDECRSLTSITIPSSVTTIGSSAFGNCESLTSITIPEGVTSIGWGAFLGCTGLTSITIPEGVTEIEERAFDKCTSLTSITIPESMITIGEKAFGNYYNMDCTDKKIIFNAISCAGTNAFSGIGVTEVSLGNRVTTIPDGLFGGCVFTSITIPSSVTSIGERAFSMCERLTSITIPSSVTTIGKYAFYECTSLTSITISEGVTEIGAFAFDGCTSLRSITIPSSVIEIGERAFDEIKEVIYQGTASGAPWGAEILLYPEGEYLYTDADKTNLYSYRGTSGDVVISESVKTIESSAFDGCTIEKVTFNAQNCNKTTIFNNMGSIKEVSFGNTVTTIPQGLFSGCSAIGSVTIPNSVVTIEASAFENCTKLKELTIGANCNSIGENAFGGCSRLVDVRCMAEDVPLASQSSFANYNGYLYVPCEYVRWYKADNIFGQFANTECIPSNDSELQSDDVAVVPEINNALFTMPRNNDANSYTLTIQNNGVTFCTLTFNENGQLSNIDFSTNKSYELKAGVSAFQFTVTGLSTAADYGYSFKALASNKSVLKEYTGSFTTKNADGTGGSSSSDNGGQGGGSGEGGQGGQGGSTAINGVSNATTVAIVNNQILVNGEAPAFVVTISGKKIANQNLKSGVYFVVVEGETVKVVK